MIASFFSSGQCTSIFSTDIECNFPLRDGSSNRHDKILPSYLTTYETERFNSAAFLGTKQM